MPGLGRRCDGPDTFNDRAYQALVELILPRLLTSGRGL